MNDREDKRDPVRTDLWRDRYGAEGARLNKPESLRQKDRVLNTF